MSVPITKVTSLREDDLCQGGADALHGDQVHPGDAEQFGAHGVGGLVLAVRGGFDVGDGGELVRAVPITKVTSGA